MAAHRDRYSIIIKLLYMYNKSLSVGMHYIYVHMYAKTLYIVLEQFTTPHVFHALHVHYPITVHNKYIGITVAHVNFHLVYLLALFIINLSCYAWAKML